MNLLVNQLNEYCENESTIDNLQNSRNFTHLTLKPKQKETQNLRAKITSHCHFISHLLFLFLYLLSPFLLFLSYIIFQF